MAGPFQFETYHNPYVQSISQLMLAPAQAQAQAAQTIGQAQANAALARGQAWSGAAQNIGQDVASIARQYAQQQQQAPINQLNAIRAREAARLEAGGQAVARMEQPQQLPPGVEGPQPENYLTPEGLFDIPKMSKALSGMGYGDKAPDLLQHAETINNSIQKSIENEKQSAKDHAVLLGDLAAGALKLANAGTPLEQAMDTVVQPALATKRIKPEEYAQVKQQLMALSPDKQVAGLTSLMDQAAQISPNKTLAEGATETDRYGRVVATGQQKAGEGQHVINGQLVGPDGKPIGEPVPKQIDPIEQALHQAQLAEINAKLNGTVPLSQKDRAELQIQRERLAMEQKNNEAAPTLTPDALNLTAKMYAMTGQLPPMGLGKTGAAVRASIINKAADEYKSLDLPQQIAAYKANQQSLTKVQGTADKVSAFENTAGKNLDQFLSLAEKIPDTGSPWVNQPIRSLDVKTLGSTDLAAANAAREVALREIARVTNDPNLSGSLTDSARKEIQGLSPESATFAQIKAVAKVLRQDMANVHSGLNEQIADIQRRIAIPPGQVVQPTAPAALVPTMRYNPATGKVEPIVKP